MIDVVPLFGPPGPDRDRVDRAIADAAGESGVLTIAGPSELVPTAASTRDAMLAVFALSDASQHSLWRNFYEPSNANVYRGWSPRSSDVGVDIYDLGPDVVPDRPGWAASNDDPLLGSTPLPPPSELPRWRETVAAYYLAMELLGEAFMRSVARCVGIDGHHFDAAFTGGISTLRLMRYELSPADPTLDSAGEPDMPRRGEHVDSGFVTLLCQHGVAGLAVKLRSGEWVEVPPVDGHIAVNFGGLLERWTEGRFRATPHRVISHGTTRFSIPFFYEPRADAMIEPLPLEGSAAFEPFTYGDHVWAAMSKFPNFTGIADLRTPRGVGGERPGPATARPSGAELPTGEVDWIDR